MIFLSNKLSVVSPCDASIKRIAKQFTKVFPWLKPPAAVQIAPFSDRHMQIMPEISMAHSSSTHGENKSPHSSRSSHVLFGKFPEVLII